MTDPELSVFDVTGLGFPCRLGAAVWRPDIPEAGVVLAVHGLSRQKRDFDDVARFLSARGYRVIALDAPGRGDSSWLQSPDDYTLENYAKIFHAFIGQHCGGGPVHWIGTSMGGLIALQMAQDGFSADFSSLTLVDITHRPNAEACARIAGYMTTTMPVMESVEQYLPFLKANLPLGPVSEDVWRRYAEYQLIKTPRGYEFHFDPNIVPAAKAQMSMQIDLTEGLRALGCPVALVAGEVSDLCSEKEVSGFKAEKPKAPVFICRGAGHVPALADDDSRAFIYGFINTR